LKKAIDNSIKDFKATLFIEDLDTKVIEKDFEVYEIELNFEEANKS